MGRGKSAKAGGERFLGIESGQACSHETKGRASDGGLVRKGAMK